MLCAVIYAVENAYVFTPFSALSIVAEGAASLTFVQRMGVKAAKEALVLGKASGVLLARSSP
jgi:peroxisomal 3,2-trans-enoyl-CoA isomerase